MRERRLFFATANDYKFEEFSRLFLAFNVQLEHFNVSVPEIQNLDMAVILRAKVIEAYSLLTRPVLVDHSGLAIRALQELPQGLNKQFWEVFKDQVCDLVGKLGDRRAEMIVYLGFCDGRRLYHVSHREPGIIAEAPSSKGSFHLDRVFIPQGCDVPLSELTTVDRDRISHRMKVTHKAIEMFRTIEFGKSLGLT